MLFFGDRTINLSYPNSATLNASNRLTLRLLTGLSPLREIRAIAIERGLSFNELSEQIGKGLISLGAEESN
jgi:hypothetical protein